jgi:DNA polymerase-3 subunit delta
MNYLLYGGEPFLLEKELEKIQKKEKIDAFNTVRYDFTIESMKNILEDCETVSFFDDKKMIIVDNAVLFNRGKGTEEDSNLLLPYLKNPNPSTILIFLNHNTTIDNTKKISKAIKEFGVMKELSFTNPSSEIEEMFQGYQIDKATIHLFQERVGEDLTILESEANKLKIYKIEEKQITKEDVLNLTTVTIDTDIFKFIDYIIQKEKGKAMTMYQEMIKEGEEPIKIIALLASKFRLMFQACELTRLGYSQQDISSTLGVHIYPVKLAIQAGYKYPTKLLLSYMNRLAQLDIQIKTGKIEPVLGLELILLDV